MTINSISLPNQPKFGRLANRREVVDIQEKAQQAFGSDARVVNPNFCHIYSRKRLFGNVQDRVRSIGMALKLALQALKNGNATSHELTEFPSKLALDTYLKKQEERAKEKGFFFSGDAQSGAYMFAVKDENGFTTKTQLKRLDDKTLLSQYYATIV